MSTQDREPRTATGASGALSERRVDPGVNARNPARVDPPSKLSPPPPKPANKVR